MSRVPVFVFPIELHFFLAARHTHKQILTLYNPYDFAVNYHIESTAPHKFEVFSPGGAIAPSCSIDVIVRYSQPSSSHCNGIEKFRIYMRDRNSDKAIGKRDIRVKFHAGDPDDLAVESTSGDDTFQPVASKGEIPGKRNQIACNDPGHRTSPVIAICVGLVSIFALLLPTQTEPSLDSALPSYMHLSVNLKLVFSFVLGLVCMIILKH